MMEQIASQRWIKPALIAAVLLLSAAMGFVYNFSFLVVVLAAVAGLGGLILLIRHTWIGLMLLVVTAIFMPFGLGTGTETNISVSFLLLAALIGLWPLKMFIEQRKFYLVPTSTTLPLVLMILSALLSFLIGQLNWFPINHAPIMAQLGGTMLFIFSAGAFLLTGNTIKKLRWLEIMTWVFTALAGIYLLATLVPALGSVMSRMINQRAYGSVFWVWLFAIPFSQATMNANLRMHWRIALGVMLAAAAYVALGQNYVWTSGWLPPLAALMTIMVISKSKFLYLAIAVGVVAAALNYETIYLLVLGGSNEYSLDTRLAAWEILGKIFEVNAVFGLGAANYYWYTPLFRIMGYYVPFNSHNNYVDIIAQTGLVGLFFYLWFLWKAGWLGINLRSRVEPGFATAYVYGAIGGLAGMVVAGMFGDWVIPFVYNVGFTGFRASMLGWLFLGGLVALEQMYPKKTDL